MGHLTFTLEGKKGFGGGTKEFGGPLRSRRITSRRGSTGAGVEGIAKKKGGGGKVWGGEDGLKGAKGWRGGAFDRATDNSRNSQDKFSSQKNQEELE